MRSFRVTFFDLENTDIKPGQRKRDEYCGPENGEPAPDNPGGDREAISNAQSCRDRACGVLGGWDLWRRTCSDALGLGAMVGANTTANRASDPVLDRLYTRHGVRPAGGFFCGVGTFDRWVSVLRSAPVENVSLGSVAVAFRAGVRNRRSVATRLAPVCSLGTALFWFVSALGE